MKLSQFTIVQEDYPQKGHHLVYNTLSRALVEIDNQGLSMLYSLREREPPKSAKPVLQKLHEMGIVVEAEFDEAESYHQKFSFNRKNANQLNATILTTLECPMQCIYCYQKHIKNGGDMPQSIMENTTSWLQEEIFKRKINRCLITFYGGEPLMNFTPIEYIGGRMSEHCLDLGISLYLSMVTSGVLLTPKIAYKLKRIGLKHLQITLDGDKDAHDKRRKLFDGSGTFDLIMENLRYLIKDFFITITCNVDKTNAEAAYRLVDILDSQGFSGKIKRLTFGPVSAPEKLAQRLHTACPETLERDLTKLTLYAAKRGFADDLRPRHKICGMLLPSSFVIDPNGILYTCPAFLSKEEYQAGSVNSQSLEGPAKRDSAQFIPKYSGRNISTTLENFSLPYECLKCAYVPICAGGCRFNALVEQGDILAISCQKEKFSYSLPLLIKAHYDLRKE